MVFLFLYIFFLLFSALVFPTERTFLQSCHILKKLQQMKQMNFHLIIRPTLENRFFLLFGLFKLVYSLESC